MDQGAIDTERVCRTCGRPTRDGLQLPQCKACAKIAGIQRAIGEMIRQDRTIQGIKRQMCRVIKEIGG